MQYITMSLGCQNFEGENKTCKVDIHVYSYAHFNDKVPGSGGGGGERERESLTECYQHCVSQGGWRIQNTSLQKAMSHICHSPGPSTSPYPNIGRDIT